jgi:hypothetical protein
MSLTKTQVERKKPESCYRSNKVKISSHCRNKKHNYCAVLNCICDCHKEGNG